MVLSIYNLLLYLTKGLLTFFRFKPKINKWLDGQQEVFNYIEKHQIHLQNVVWFHCASTGEFEQGRPIIESIKLQFPNQRILLTFFSSTAFQAFQQYAYADFICYLPLDTKRNARQFIEVTQPKFAVFVKYEFWWNYLQQLHLHEIPFYYTSFITRKNHYFWKIPTFVQLLKNCSHFFVQNKESAAILANHHFLNYSISGDCRIDRVVEISEKVYQNTIIEHFRGNTNLLILGSAWEGDKILAYSILNKLPLEWKVLLAPHELKENQLQQWQKDCPISVQRYTQYDQETEARCLIFDTIGHLALSYRYGKIAFIGGGFEDGIHNILEPLAYHLPVLFGPKFTKFQEAHDAIHLGFGKAVFTKEDFEQQLFIWINNSNSYSNATQKAANYIEENKGATLRVMQVLRSLLSNELY